MAHEPTERHESMSGENRGGGWLRRLRGGGWVRGGGGGDGVDGMRGRDGGDWGVDRRAGWHAAPPGLGQTGGTPTSDPFWVEPPLRFSGVRYCRDACGPFARWCHGRTRNPGRALRGTAPRGGYFDARRPLDLDFTALCHPGAGLGGWSQYSGYRLLADRARDEKPGRARRLKSMVAARQARHPHPGRSGAPRAHRRSVLGAVPERQLVHGDRLRVRRGQLRLDDRRDHLLVRHVPAGPGITRNSLTCSQMIDDALWTKRRRRRGWLPVDAASSSIV